MQAPSSESTLTARLSETSSASDLQQLGARQGIELPDFQNVLASSSHSHDDFSWPATDWQLETSLQSAEASICSMFQDESCSAVFLEEANHCATTLPHLDLAAPDFADFCFQEEGAEQSRSAASATPSHCEPGHDSQ